MWHTGAVVQRVARVSCMGVDGGGWTRRHGCGKNTHVYRRPCLYLLGTCRVVRIAYPQWQHAGAHWSMEPMLFSLPPDQTMVSHTLGYSILGYNTSTHIFSIHAHTYSFAGCHHSCKRVGCWGIVMMVTLEHATVLRVNTYLL